MTRSQKVADTRGATLRRTVLTGHSGVLNCQPFCEEVGSVTEYQRRTFRVSDDLLKAARRELGLGDAVTDSDVLRAALARVGRLDITQHTPKLGRPPTGTKNAAA
jgi:hypothetical protein